MQKIHLWLTALAASLLSVSVYAGDIQIEGAWVRATAPGQVTATGDLHLTSKHPASLVGVASPVAQRVELHRMTHDNGMMQMREVQAIELPAGKRVDMGESGYHLMLTGLKQPLNEQDKVELVLTVRLADGHAVHIKTVATVGAVSGSEHHEHMHDQDGQGR